MLVPTLNSKCFKAGLCLFVGFLAIQCSNQSGKKTQGPERKDKTVKEPTPPIPNTKDPSAANTTGPDANERLKRLSTGVSAEEASESKTIKENYCASQNTAKIVEFIFYTSPVTEQIDVVPLISASKEFLDTVEQTATKVANPGEPAPTATVSHPDGEVLIVKFMAGYPQTQPSFDTELLPSDSSKKISMAHDENTEPLLNGPYRTKKVSVQGNTLISELRTIRVSQQKAIIMTTNLTENAFRTATGKPQVTIKEASRRVLERVTVKINGNTVYDRDDVYHLFSLSQDDEIQHNTYGLIWEDTDFRQNKHFLDYMEQHKACKS